LRRADVVGRLRRAGSAARILLSGRGCDEQAHREQTHDGRTIVIAEHFPSTDRQTSTAPGISGCVDIPPPRTFSTTMTSAHTSVRIDAMACVRPRRPTPAV